MWIFLSVFLIILAISLMVPAVRTRLPMPSIVPKGIIALGLVSFCIGIFDNVFFYAEPAYIYHVRTIFGTEKMVRDVGYTSYWFGRLTQWKRAMTVQFDQIKGRQQTSASLPPLRIMFLDQVDADASATVRFRLPENEQLFLHMAHEYRTPENLLRTALIPTARETLSATASLMNAEEYFSGGKLVFTDEFRNQMINGIYTVERREEVVSIGKRAKGTANLAIGERQKFFGEATKTVFRVVKITDEHGQIKRKLHTYREFGITLVDAIVTDMHPNENFVLRMQQKQQASADRAIAKEKKIQEEEQRLLAIAQGERRVAEEQAKMKVDQIKRTTLAETEKQLTLTRADKLKEQAKIDRERSVILLEKAKIDAQAVKVEADARAYMKHKVLEADNALSQKLEALVNIHGKWAAAFAQRKVPGTIIGSGHGQGISQDSSTFQAMLNALLAKQLAFDPSISPMVNRPNIGP